MLDIISKENIFRCMKYVAYILANRSCTLMPESFLSAPHSIPGNTQRFEMSHVSVAVERTNKGIGAHGTDGGDGNNLGKGRHI